MRKLFGRSAEVFPVKRIRAARALYVSDEIQRIEVTMELENGETIRVDMTPKKAHEFIVTLESAYNAIHPPITRQNPNSPSW